MTVATLTGLIVCLISPLLVASSLMFAQGKVGWFFLTVLGAGVAIGNGMAIGMSVAGPM